MSILASAELLLQAKNYSGSGEWLDESGNGHDAQLGSTAGADTNDPLFLAYGDTKYVYFPGSANNEFSVAGLSATTTYDFTVTYEDDSTDTGTQDSDGSGNLVLGNTGVEFAGLKIKDVSVYPDGGGAEVAGINASAFTEPFASAVGRQGKTWTINRSSTGRKTTVVDRDLFLLGTDDYFVIADDPGLDFALTDPLTALIVMRSYDLTATEGYLVKKAGGDVETGWSIWSYGSGPVFSVADGTNHAFDTHVAPNAGELYVTAGRRSITADEVETFVDAVSTGSPTTDSNTATSANALLLLIGSYPGSAWMAGEVVAVALWREALTDEEIAEASTILVNGYVPSAGQQARRSPRYGLTRLARR